MAQKQSGPNLQIYVCLHTIDFVLNVGRIQASTLRVMGQWPIWASNTCDALAQSFMRVKATM